MNFNSKSLRKRDNKVCGKGTTKFAEMFQLICFCGNVLRPTFEIHFLTWEKCDGFKLVHGIPIFTLLIFGSPTNTEIYKRWKEKTVQIRFHSKIPYTITKMNDNINMDSTIAG